MMTRKFESETIIEIDDLYGDRVLALVCQDGVTYQCHQDSTPEAIGDSLNPIEVGPFPYLHLPTGTLKVNVVIQWLNEFFPNNINDLLFVSSVFWLISSTASENVAIEKERIIELGVLCKNSLKLRKDIENSFEIFDRLTQFL